MDGSMFAGAFKGLFWAVVIGGVVLLGGGIACGYFLRGCDGHPVVRWERAASPASPDKETTR